MNSIQKIFFLLICITILCYPVMTYSQSGKLTGTFVNANRTINLQIKQVNNEYHGLITSQEGNFVLRGTISEQLFQGTIFTQGGPANFQASTTNDALVIESMGYRESFYQISPEHSLAEVDLTQYMTNTSPSQGQDFDYSYTQHDRGHASESMQTYPDQSVQVQSPYPALQDQELYNMVSGCLVVIYNRTSYVLDDVASSITYAHYCRNGTFYITYDSSFSVDGDYGGNAQGASYGKNSGSWKLVTYQGQPAVFLAFNNGTSNVYPVNKQLIRQGKWRIGNTQYAVQQGGAQCR